MGTDLMDRRVARTRRALHDALIALILERGYENITVQDIIEAADVGRATFYAHYRSKDDLLRGGFESLPEELRARASRPGEQAPFAFSLAMFEHACAYRRVYAALVGGPGGAIVVQQIRKVLEELVKDELPTAGDGLSRQVRIEFVVATFITVLTLCLNKRGISSPAEAATVFKRLTTAGLGMR